MKALGISRSPRSSIVDPVVVGGLRRADHDIAALPGDALVQVVEHGHCAAGCERAGGVDDIALEDEPQPRPVVCERALPVGAEQPREPVDAGARPAVNRLEPRRERVPVRDLEVSPDLLGWGRPDATHSSSNCGRLDTGGGVRKSGTAAQGVQSASRVSTSIPSSRERAATAHGSCNVLAVGRPPRAG